MTCTITIKRGRLLAALKATIPFVCQDPTRFHMASVSMEIVDPRKTLRLVATDGHTLARVHVATTSAESVTGTHQTLLRDVDARSLVKTLACRKAELDMPVTIVLDEGKIVVKIGDATSTFTGVDATFPPYDQVIPKFTSTPKLPNGIGIAPQYLARVGDAVKDFGRDPESPRPLRLQFGDALDPMLATFDDPDLGEFLAVVMPMRLS